MLDAEADRLCGAGRYERNEARQDTRAGSYDRTLQTSAGEVNLKVPKLRRQTFETAIIEPDWLAGAAGFERLHIRIGICQDSQPGGRNSNLRIPN